MAAVAIDGRETISVDILNDIVTAVIDRWQIVQAIIGRVRCKTVSGFKLRFGAIGRLSADVPRSRRYQSRLRNQFG